MSFLSNGAPRTRPPPSRSKFYHTVLVIFCKITDWYTSLGVGNPPLPGNPGSATDYPWLKLLTLSSGMDPGFPVGGGANPPGGVPTYNFAKFCEKLHEIEKILGHGGGRAPLVLLIKILKPFDQTGLIFLDIKMQNNI